MTVTVSAPEAARSLRPLVAEESAASERRRTLTARTVEALWESGLLQRFNPAEAGGAEPSFAEMIETWIELAWQDGSLGWIGIANLPSAAACAVLPSWSIAWYSRSWRSAAAASLAGRFSSSAIPLSRRLTRSP